MLSIAERALLDEIALARRSPSAYADVIERARIGKYNPTDNSLTTGGSIFDTIEGEAGAREAIGALRAMGGVSLPELNVPEGIMRTVREAVEVNGSRPNGLTLLDKHGTISGSVKQSTVLGMDVAADIVMFMLIDDGSKERTKRQTLLDPTLRHIGISISSHPEFESLAVLLFAENWQDKKQ